MNSQQENSPLKTTSRFSEAKIPDLVPSRFV